jgi:hypothetical protein
MALRAYTKPVLDARRPLHEATFFLVGRMAVADRNW